MRHRASYIQAVEDALSCKDSAGETALVVIARNWVREAMDPESPNYKMALKELNEYVLGKPEENINLNVGGTVHVLPSPAALAMMGLKSALVRTPGEGGQVIEMREVKALGSSDDD